MKYFGVVTHLPIVKLQTRHPLKNVGSMTMSMGNWNNRAEAEKEYKGHFAQLPRTRKLLNLSQKGCIYHQVFDIDCGCLLIESNTLRGLYTLFEIIKSCLGVIDLNFSDEIDLIRIMKRPPRRNCSMSDLYSLAGLSKDPFAKKLFESDLCSGLITEDKKIQDLSKPIRRIASKQQYRKTLACYWFSQNIFYTHLIASYIDCHSKPDLKAMSKEEYRIYNFIQKEKMALSFIAAYRGLEAIFNHRFSEKDFKNGISNLSQIIDNKIKGLYWNTKYQRFFYNKRHKKIIKKSKIATMIKYFLIVRNRRVGHGLEWPHETIKYRLTRDMVDEIHAFLAYLIYFLLFK